MRYRTRMTYSVLAALMTMCRLSGVIVALGARLSTGGPAVPSQGYADDCATFSRAYDSLQTLLDAAAGHSTANRWDLSVPKTFRMLIQHGPLTPEPAASPVPTWQGAPLPLVDRAKYLGLHVSQDGRWTKHLTAAKDKGNKALFTLNNLLVRSGVRMSAKIHCVRTLLVPTMRYALEVITCDTRAERSALAALDAIVVKALTHAVSGRRHKYAQLHAHVKASVLFALLDVSPISTEMDAAHLRFALKDLPHILAQTVSSDGGPAPDSLTHSMREALPDTHPWQARTAHLAAELQLDLSSPHTDHAALRDALRARDRQASLSQLRPSSAAPRTRASRALAHHPPLDVYATILPSLDNAACMHNTKRALLGCTSDIALPFVQLCSGHLPDDPVTLAGPHCHLCARHLCPTAGDALPERGREWHHVWHNLIECPTRAHRRSALAHFTWVLLDRMRAMPAVQLRYRKLFDQVAAHAAMQPGGPAAPLSLRHDFLTFLVNPTEHMPPGTHLATMRDVVNLLDNHRTYNGAADVTDTSSASGTDHDADLYREAVAALAPRPEPRRSRKTTARARLAPGRRAQPRCPPRRRNRRRDTVEADAPFVG